MKIVLIQCNLLLLFGILFLASMIVAAIVSISENESKAAKRFLLTGLFLSIPYFLLAAFSFPGKEILFSLFVLLPLGGLILFFIPFGKNRAYRQVIPAICIDERDTMFSRNELESNTEPFKSYYRRYPDRKLLDDRFRDNPGLLQKGTTQYHPWHFAAADAGFETIAALRNKVDGPVREEKIAVAPEKMSRYIKNWSKKLGAVDCGITLLHDYHLYSTGGRGERYGKEYVKQHKFAIAFTVEMSHKMVQGAPAGSMVMESGQQYLEAGKVALQIAYFIRNMGYEARAHIDGNYEVVCPLVARDAGLGEIGRMGLLMTPKMGPRVRISVVTTNLPLVTDKPLHDFSFIDFCTICKKCADVCPSRAISFNNRESINGSLRWQINQESCFTFWTKTGTDCGRCISVCPYSHPNNILHNLVRTGIRNSLLFRKIALPLDDAFYGRKPVAGRIPKWMRE